MELDLNGKNTYFTLTELSQKIAEAIESVLKIDVTIMDDRMIRIAGTGRYRDSIGQKIEPKTAFETCLMTGKPNIIVEAKKDHMCVECPRLSNCTEKAEICVPIVYKGKVMGVIGIIAFDEEQQEIVKQNQDKYLNFLLKMASLIEGKIAENEMAKENETLSRRLVSILNTINEGLILFDSRGSVLYKNAALSKLFKELGVNSCERLIEKIWSHPVIQQCVECNDVKDARELLLECEGSQYALLANIMDLGEKHKEYIITLQNLRKIQKQIIRITERNQIKLNFEDILGESPNFVEAKNIARRAAESDSSVLIFGESGTGKELFARAIHNHSSRADHPFVAINCGAIPDELLESEMFGYEKGAFTGAVNTKMGKFEVAENGTLFLDEISEMPLRLQVKLLRAIQEREICRIGSNKVRKINVRIISATNRDLLKMINEGLFREDLYYRLNIIPIRIPPLRERDADIMYIAEYFVDHYNRMFGKKILGISPEARELFLSYPWPGNVRELQNVIEFAVNFENGQYISRELIEKRLHLHDKASGLINKVVRESDMDSLENNVKKFERAFIMERLKAYKNHHRKSIIMNLCQDLKLSRATLYRKLKELDIRIESHK